MTDSHDDLDAIRARPEAKKAELDESMNSLMKMIKASERIQAEETEQARIAGEMLAGWKVIIPAHADLASTPARQAQLHLLFTQVFDRKLLRWVEFIDRIASNKSLMGKVAGGNIDWAIELENCQMILVGDYPDSLESGTSGGANDTAPPAATPATPAIPADQVEYLHGGLLARRKLKSDNQT